MCSRYKFADEVGKKVVEQNSHVKNVLMALIVMGNHFLCDESPRVATSVGGSILGYFTVVGNSLLLRQIQ